MKQLLQEICIPRAAGTEGNRKVTEMIRNSFEEYGLEVHGIPFSCLVWNSGDSYLCYEGGLICVHVSPFSNPVRGNAITREISSVEELRRSECEGEILFLTGKLSEEALQPKDYPFYYPDEHKEIIDLLEEKKPLAVIGVRDGGPMFEDGNFTIPSGYMTAGEYGKIRNEVIGKAWKYVSVPKIQKKLPNSCMRSENVKTRKAELSLRHIWIQSMAHPVLWITEPG